MGGFAGIAVDVPRSLLPMWNRCVGRSSVFHLLLSLEKNVQAIFRQQRHKPHFHKALQHTASQI